MQYSVDSGTTLTLDDLIEIANGNYANGALFKNM